MDARRTEERNRSNEADFATSLMQVDADGLPFPLRPTLQSPGSFMCPWSDADTGFSGDKTVRLKAENAAIALSVNSIGIGTVAEDGEKMSAIMFGFVRTVLDRKSSNDED
jgi:hypothetical protein